MIKSFNDINFLKYKEEFLDKIKHLIPSYPGNSLFFSEGLFIYSLSKEFKIDLLIESGVFRGGSTRIWANSLPNINIECIDILESERHISIVNNVIKELSSPYINFTIGDSNKILPNIIKNNPQKTIGVFVDGPKDKEGLELCKEALKYNNVKFATLHDFSMLNDHKHFSTKTNSNYIKLVGDINKNHPQIHKYKNGPGVYGIIK